MKIDCRAAGRTPAKIGRIVDGLSLALPVPIRLDPAERQAAMAKKKQGKINKNLPPNTVSSYLDMPLDIPGKTREEKVQRLYELWVNHMSSSGKRSERLYIEAFMRGVQDRYAKYNTTFDDRLFSLYFHRSKIELAILLEHIDSVYRDAFIGRFDKNDIFNIVKVAIALLRIGLKRKEIKERITIIMLHMNFVFHGLERVLDRLSAYSREMNPDIKTQKNIKPDAALIERAYSYLRDSIIHAEQEIYEVGLRNATEDPTQTMELSTVGQKESPVTLQAAKAETKISIPTIRRWMKSNPPKIRHIKIGGKVYVWVSEVKGNI
jgi:hypothetical protein